MANIITLSKFPPLEGGIAARTYWLAKALGEKGHTVHIVTDRIEIDSTYCITDSSSFPMSQNVTVHRVSNEEIPHVIPSAEHVALSLLNKGLEIFETYGADVIEGSYLIPYGLVAWMLAKIAGIPLVLRHGGSDIGKFVIPGVWPKLWYHMFSDARVVISDYVNEASLQSLAQNIKTLPPYTPDPTLFSPIARTNRHRPVLALVGKANYHWQHKGWHRVIDIWNRLGDDFEYLIVCQGRGEERFRQFVEEKMGNRVQWKRFVAPWEMPELMRSIDALFCFETDFPFPMFSNLSLEALWSGAYVITDNPKFVAQYRRYGVVLEHTTDLVLPVLQSDSSEVARIIAQFLLGSEKPRHSEMSYSNYRFYIDENEKAVLFKY